MAVGKGGGGVAGVLKRRKITRKSKTGRRLKYKLYSFIARPHITVLVDWVYSSYYHLQQNETAAKFRQNLYEFDSSRHAGSCFTRKRRKTFHLITELCGTCEQKLAVWLHSARNAQRINTSSSSGFSSPPPPPPHPPCGTKEALTKLILVYFWQRDTKGERRR